MRYAGTVEDAEQWVHDAFLKIFTSLEQYAASGSFEGWVRKITVRLCIDRLREKKSRKNEVHYHTVYTIHESADTGHYISEDAVSRFTGEEVFRLLNMLPEKQKTVFNLIVFEAYSHKETAALLQISENHSYWLLHQARKQLKEIITLSEHKKTRIKT